MRKISYMIICLLLALTSCDVHEWPDTPGYVKLHLRLNYETKMMKWEHTYDGNEVNEVGLGETYDNHQEDGLIRYIIRTYPVSKRSRGSMHYMQEFVFTKHISKGYDHEVTLDLLPGDFNLMVWSDLVENDGDFYYYNTSNFAEIRLEGDHAGNTDYRDAFRGMCDLSIVSDIVERLPDTLDIAMQRPMAKFELITTDVKEFVDREVTRLTAHSNNSSSSEEVTTKTVNLEDYAVVLYYVGFMPDVYSMNTDKPVDSSTGVIFESSLKKLSESEASIGFDYVFTNGHKSQVSIQIGIYDNQETQLSLTDPIGVPLMRDRHTILSGNFMTSEASGGVSINPEFDGEYNLVFP